MTADFVCVQINFHLLDSLVSLSFYFGIASLIALTFKIEFRKMYVTTIISFD